MTNGKLNVLLATALDKAADDRALASRIMKRFAEQGKPMIGHCAAALLYDNLGIARGRRVALHPFLKTVVRECIPTDDKAVVDGNFYTAQTENTLSELMPRVLQALK